MKERGERVDLDIQNMDKFDFSTFHVPVYASRRSSLKGLIPPGGAEWDKYIKHAPITKYQARKLGFAASYEHVEYKLKLNGHLELTLWLGTHNRELKLYDEDSDCTIQLLYGKQCTFYRINKLIQALKQ